MTETEPQITEEEALWRAVGANPAHALPRLVLADWYDERASVAKLTWSDRVPARAGFYWLRPVGRDTVRMAVLERRNGIHRVTVFGCDDTTGAGGEIVPGRDGYGWWWGPITPPEDSPC